MTWGQIEDTPQVQASRRYQMQEDSERDLLRNKIAQQMLKKKKSAEEAKKPRYSSNILWFLTISNGSKGMLHSRHRMNLVLALWS